VQTLKYFYNVDPKSWPIVQALKDPSKWAHKHKSCPKKVFKKILHVMPPPKNCVVQKFSKALKCCPQKTNGQKMLFHPLFSSLVPSFYDFIL